VITLLDPPLAAAQRRRADRGSTAACALIGCREQLEPTRVDASPRVGVRVIPAPAAVIDRGGTAFERASEEGSLRNQESVGYRCHERPFLDVTDSSAAR
jgi:hypothetical protein